MNPHYPAVAERADNRCEYCHAPEQVFNFPFEVEHIWPRAQGGDESFENLALSCESCNLFKSDATMGFDTLEGMAAKLFHPRQHQWHEHFLFDADEAAIQAQTAIGRVTVTRLRMNSAFQVRARRQWMLLELYP